jgi:hypothetical protein
MNVPADSYPYSSAPATAPHRIFPFLWRLDADCRAPLVRGDASRRLDLRR